MNDKSIKEDYSFGIIPLKREASEWKVFLIQHLAGHWAFPKGHPEPSESPQKTALRELKEETSLELVRFINETPLIETYHFVNSKNILIFKTVSYFLAEVKGTIKLQKEEIKAGEWFNFSEAFKQLSFKEAKLLCRKAQILCTE